MNSNATTNTAYYLAVFNPAVVPRDDYWIFTDSLFSEDEYMF
jgi:hypothetical protein